MGALSLRKYAEHRKRLGLPGASHEAVRRAIGSGRLDKGLARDAAGEVIGIADPDLCDREWKSSTDRTRAPNAVKARASESEGPSREAADRVEYDLGHEAAREKHWKASIAELEYRTRAGDLVPVEEVETRLADAISAARTKLLGVSRRIRQRLPHLATEDADLIHGLIREALEDLADAGGPGAEA